tara:strand:+ start:1822 stop:2616 length:795 start_codon:yes stop_codon:yes gene_type:complete
MKKYLVIGNPIDHSLSPKLHNYWIKNNNIDAIYEKKKIENDEIENLLAKIKNKTIHGINVTVPFKKKVIPFIDKLSLESDTTQSVNTIFEENDKIIGHNTDIEGFENSLNHIKFNITGKKVLILGAGGVVPSIIYALNKMKSSEIILSNRTKAKAEKLKDLYKNINIVNWGELPNFDVIINATSVGLNSNQEIGIDLSKTGKNKFFFDVIYNPAETNFLKLGKKLGNKTENGKMMFIYQAQKSFQKWHKILPNVNKEVLDLLDD